MQRYVSSGLKSSLSSPWGIGEAAAVTSPPLAVCAVAVAPAADVGGTASLDGVEGALPMGVSALLRDVAVGGAGVADPMRLFAAGFEGSGAVFRLV